MADCCIQESTEFQLSFQQDQTEQYAQNHLATTPSPIASSITIPQCAPLLFSSFIEQQSQVMLNLCLFADQVVIAQDRLAKSTLIFDGNVRFGIYSESNGSQIFSRITFSKDSLSTTFVFLNSAEAQLWYKKLLELGIPQLVQVGQPTFEQQQQFIQEQIMNALLAKEQEKVKTHTRKPSIFKYESLDLPYQGIYNHLQQSNKSTNKRFQKSSSDIASFFYKLVLTREIRCNPKQDALVLQHLLL